MMAKYPGVKQLFDDSDEIIRCTKQAGINPIMHVVALTQAVVEKIPICRSSSPEHSRKPAMPLRPTWMPTRLQVTPKSATCSAKIPMPI